MSDVINLNEFKNKVRDKDIDELENYVYSLYFQVAEGRMTLADVNREIRKYMQDNSISETKFMEIQKKLVERYGYNADDLEKQLLEGGQGILLQKKQGLLEKYGHSIKEMNGVRKDINNEKNHLVLFCSGIKVIILSETKVDLEDNELQEFLVSYKRQAGNDILEIELAENASQFKY
ncbi:MAG: DUF3867 family protein [Clostridiaceae bacterium]